jgi:hypothetical protein
MMKGICNKSILVLFVASSQVASANAGNFFSVTSSGTPASIKLTLCLNGRGQLSCQNYTATGETLSIRTLIPNHTYPDVGIKINTPGYAALAGCTLTANGYCIFSANNTSATTVTLNTPVSSDTTLTADVTSIGLSVNDPTLNAALTGNQRAIIIRNAGSNPALNVTYSLTPNLPVDATIDPASCGDMAVGDTCQLTIFPGATPTATPGNISPTPLILAIEGENTNTLSPTVNIVTYGSVYQGGYVFSVDDTYTAERSIGGTVLATANEGGGVMWATDGFGNPDFTDIAGINENSNTPGDACDGGTDGACDTNVIISTFPGITLSEYASGRCEAIGWYLPSICEMGYDNGLSSGSGCGPALAPTLQNVQSSLVDNGDIGSLSGLGFWWTSTQSALGGGTTAWRQQFNPLGGDQSPLNKASTIFVRCARSINPEYF